MQTKFKLAFRRAALATHVGAFAGPGGGPAGNAFGFDIWSREAASARLGFGIESMQATALTMENGSHSRNDAQAFLAGPELFIGGIAASLMAGKTDSTVIESTPDGFSRGQQSGITIGKFTLSCPIDVTERVAIAFSASRHVRLGGGSTPVWQRQAFRARQESGGQGGLALTDEAPGSRRDPHFSTAAPGDFLDRATTVGVSLIYRFETALLD